jgi:hypothetical protein
MLHFKDFSISFRYNDDADLRCYSLSVTQANREDENKGLKAQSEMKDRMKQRAVK